MSLDVVTRVRVPDYFYVRLNEIKANAGKGGHLHVNATVQQLVMTEFYHGICSQSNVRCEFACEEEIEFSINTDSSELCKEYG